MTAASQLASRGQAARPCPDDRHSTTGTLDGDDVVVHVPASPIGDKAFQVADCNRRSLAPAHAFGFALMLLRAHPARHRRQRVVAKQRPRRRGQITSLDAGHERRNVDRDRATLDTRWTRARDAALRFQQRQVLGETKIDLVERTRPLARIARWHLLSVDCHALAFGQWFARHGISCQPTPRHS